MAWHRHSFSSIQSLSHVWLCDPMDCSTPGLPVHHQLPEFNQTHVHWASDAIQSPHPLCPLFLLPSIFPSIRVISNELALCIRWPMYWSFNFNLNLAIRLVFIPIPKKGNAKECSNYCTFALISHASKVMLKILQARLQQYMNHELPDGQAGFRKGRGTRDQIANIRWIIEKARDFRKTSTSALLTMPKLLTV